MDFTLLQLFLSFVYSVGLGFVFGIIYEPIRIFHFCGFTKNHHYFVSDMLFVVIFAVVTYYYCIITLEGEVRMFVIVGELTGFVLYFYLVAPFTKKVFLPVIKISKKFLLILLKKYRHIMYNIACRLNSLFSIVKSCLKRFCCLVNSKVEKNEKGKRRQKRKRQKRNKRSKNQ